MADLQPLSDDERAELVAYLDGEADHARAATSRPSSTAIRGCVPRRKRCVELGSCGRFSAEGGAVATVQPSDDERRYCLSPSARRYRPALVVGRWMGRGPGVDGGSRLRGRAVVLSFLAIHCNR